MIKLPQLKKLCKKLLTTCSIFKQSNKIHHFKTKYFKLISSNIVDCFNTIIRSTRLALEIFFLPISWQAFEISNEIGRQNENTNMLAKKDKPGDRKWS